MPYVVHVRRAGASEDMFLIPKVLCRSARREVQRARGSQGLGIMFDPLPLPRIPFYRGPVDAWYCKIGWREWHGLVNPGWSP